MSGSRKCSSARIVQGELGGSKGSVRWPRKPQFSNERVGKKRRQPHQDRWIRGRRSIGPSKETPRSVWKKTTYSIASLPSFTAIAEFHRA